MHARHAQPTLGSRAWASQAKGLPGIICRSRLPSKCNIRLGATSVALEGDLSSPLQGVDDELPTMAWIEDGDLESYPVTSKMSSAMQMLLDEFRILLREYRELEARVKPWSTSYAEAHGGQQPTWRDAEEHGGPEFAATFKEATVLKKRIYYEIPALRRSLVASLEAATKGRIKHKEQGFSAKNINIDRSGPSAGALSQQLSLARNYRKRSASQKQDSASTQATPPINTLAGVAGDIMGDSANAAARSPSENSEQVDTEQPSSSAVVPGGVTGGLSPAAAVSLEMMLSAAKEADEKDRKSADLLAVSGPGNSRIKNAALAALQYRKKAKQNTESTASDSVPAPPLTPPPAKNAFSPTQSPSSGNKKAVEISIERAQFVVRSGRRTLQEDVLPLCPP